MSEVAQRLAEMRIEHDERMGVDHHQNGRGPKQIEAENAAVRRGGHWSTWRIHRFFWWPTISLSHVRRSTRVRCFSRPRLSNGRWGMSQRYSAMNQMSLSDVIQRRRSKRRKF